MTIPERTGLIVPVVLWGRKSPRNRICQVSCLQNGRIIITGTVDGQIIQWVVDETLGWIQPQMMLLAHECAITCISPTSSSPTSTKYVTCSKDGHICLWDSVDGRVIESVRGNYVHRHIIAHNVRSSLVSHHQTYLFCIGDYADVLVMDAQDLNILFSLGSRVEPDWISTLTIVQPLTRFDVVIGVSVSGMIKLWSLNDLEKKNSNHVIYEDESKVMTTRNVNYIHCSNLNTRMMLVICNSSWQIIDPSNLNQLIVSECAIEAIRGTIIDIDRVAIGFADSTIVLFQLPRSKLVGKQIRERFGETPQNIGNIDQPFVFSLVKGIGTSPSMPLSNPVQFHFDYRLNSEGKLRRVAYRVDEQGTLSVWHIPKNFDLLVNEFIRSRRPVVYEPTIRQNCNDVWSRLTSPPPTISGPEDDQPITSTIYVGNQGKLFLGRGDGSIVMMNACQAIIYQLLETMKPEVPQHRMLCGHSAAVNCFLYPYEENPRYDQQILLSGGADFAVVVWNIFTGVKLHRFCCQGGAVLRMLVPPSNCSYRVLHSICAIATDNSASLLSLKEHKCILLASRQQFPIVDIRWRPLDDFMLLRCEDDSVYVWEIETCKLDRIVTGLTTEDVMDACNEQVGLADVEDEAGASQAVQMLRALKNKNVAAIRKIAAHSDDKNVDATALAFSSSMLSPPLDIVQLRKYSDQTQLLLFNVDNLIAGLLALDYELSSSFSSHSHVELSDSSKMSLSTLISKKADQHFNQNHLPHSNHHVIHPPLHHHNQNQSQGIDSATAVNNGGGNSSDPSLMSSNHSHNLQLSPGGGMQKVTSASAITANGSIDKAGAAAVSATKWQAELSLYLETARLLLSLLHAWNLDENLDPICVKTLKLLKPKMPICYGTISRRGHIALYMPYCSGKMPALNDMSFRNFSRTIRWQENRTLTTAHLLSVIALSNTLMSFKGRSIHLTGNIKRQPLRRVSSSKGTMMSENAAENESQQIRQGWSNVAALHCVLLPDFLRPLSPTYAAPRIDLLARRWQDNCIEIRDAAQALLIREIDRMGPQGRRKLIDYWMLFLPTLLDPSLSIFGIKLNNASNSVTLPSYSGSTNATVSPPNNLAKHFTTGNNSSNLTTMAAESNNNNNSGSAPKPPPPPRPPVPPVPPRHRDGSAPPLPNPTSLSVADSSSKSSISTASSGLMLSGGGGGHPHSNETTASVVSSSQDINSSRQTPNSLVLGAHTEGSAPAADPSVVVAHTAVEEACGGIHQVRRNQATAIIVLSVIGAEFPADLQANVDLVRATAHSLLELLVTGESPLLPLNSPLRRAAIDLLGRGFVVWQPHLDISKVILTLLELATNGEKALQNGVGPEHFGMPISPAADACRTARHSLSLIASARPQALITALSMEVVWVARYNSATQHQTIQHAVVSPLLRYRAEVLRLIELLSEKQYNCVADLIIPVGDILVHCLDTSLLKQRTLAEVFPPIAKFYMVAYCTVTRRIAFGGKNGSINVHELRASKAQTVHAHKSPITALAFSQDGKYLAAYASHDAKISFWQTQQTFLGMGQSQIRCVKTLPAPSEFPVISPGGSYQSFRARLVWINAKSLTLMLPNGKENRFTV